MAGLAGGHLLVGGPLLPRHLLRYLHQPFDLLWMALGVGRRPIAGLLLPIFCKRNRGATNKRTRDNKQIALGLISAGA